jgi:hypothetical protein
VYDGLHDVDVDLDQSPPALPPTRGLKPVSFAADKMVDAMALAVRMKDLSGGVAAGVGASGC